MILKEFKERIDKLIEKQYNGCITFEDCVKECNEIVNEYKNFLFGCEIMDAENWKRTTQLRMYMLNQLMGLLIDLDYED